MGTMFIEDVVIRDVPEDEPVVWAEIRGNRLGPGRFTEGFRPFNFNDTRTANYEDGIEFFRRVVEAHRYKNTRGEKVHIAVHPRVAETVGLPLEANKKMSNKIGELYRKKAEDGRKKTHLEVRLNKSYACIEKFQNSFWHRLKCLFKPEKINEVNDA